MADNEVLLPAVLFDGSLGRDFLSGTDFVRHLFDARSAERVLAAFVDAGLEPCLNIDHPTQDFVLGEHPSTHPEHMAFNVERTRCCELVGAARSLPVFTFSVCGVERALLAPVLHAVAASPRRRSPPTACSGPQPLGPAPRREQVTGVLAYCAAHGLDPEAVLAVGDGENDLELLAAASIACVPRTAARPPWHSPPTGSARPRPAAGPRWTTSSAEVPRRASGGAGAGRARHARPGVEAPGHGQRAVRRRVRRGGRPQALDDGGDTARHDEGEQQTDEKVTAAVHGAHGTGGTPLTRQSAPGSMESP